MDLTDPHLVRPWILPIAALVALALGFLHVRRSSGRAARLASLLDPRALARGTVGVSEGRRGLKAALARRLAAAKK